MIRSQSLRWIAALGMLSTSAIYAQTLDVTDVADCQITLSDQEVVTLLDGSITVQSSGDLPPCLAAKGGIQVDFDTNVNTIQSGEEVTINYSVDDSDESTCRITANGTTILGNANVVRGVDSSVTHSPTTDTTYRLNCSKELVASVTVEGGSTGGNGDYPVPAFCDTERPMPNSNIVAHDTTVSWLPLIPGEAQRNADEYSDIYGEWPGGSGLVRRIYIDKGTFIALPFVSTGNVGQGWQLTAVAGSRPPEVTYATIDECPGNFVQNTLTDTGCSFFLTQESGNIVASVGGNTGGCNLKPNTVYFLNMVHALPQSLGTTQCINSNQPWCDLDTDVSE